MLYKITNTGLLPLYDMTSQCLVNTRHFHNVRLQNFLGQGEIARLGSKESTTTSCPAMVGMPSFPSDVQVIVSARTPAWFRTTFKRRFL